MKRRLFLPRRGARDDEYDYGHEVAQQMKKEEERLAAARAAKREQSAKAGAGTGPFAVGDDDDDDAYATDAHGSAAANSLGALSLSPSAAEKSDAQKYKDTIDMTPRIAQEGDEDGGPRPPTSSDATSSSNPAPSIHGSAPSYAPSALSVRTTATTLALSRGELPKHPRLDGSINVSSFRPPPSITGDSYRSVDPWNAPSYRGRTEFDRPLQSEVDKGITRAEELMGEGNVPTKGEVEENAAREGSDAATIKTRATARTTTGSEGPLLISDIFIPDPRPFHPLRLVRRTDPRQALVVCSGLTMTSRQATSYQAAQRAALDQRRAKGESVNGPDLYKAEQAKKLLESFGGDESGAIRGGLGVYYCPPAPPGSHDATARVEPNFSRRMERVVFPYNPTPTRAVLRSVIAALEYVHWHEEGFDKIVVAVGCAHEWLVRGIAVDLHEWRRNNWKLSRPMRTTRSPTGGAGEVFGQVGDTVPDRDLWECLDEVVTKWEEVDVSVRFWCLAPQEEEQRESLVVAADELAREGAAKDNQQPQMVRWVKKRVQK